MSDTTANLLADLVKAIGQLAPRDDETRREIAVLLGITQRYEEGRVLQGTDEQPVAPARPEVPEVPPPPSSSPKPSSLIKEKIPSKLELISQPDSRPPDWLNQVQLLDEPLNPNQYATASLEPLFLSRWTRHILSGSLSVAREEGRVNMEAIIATIARAEPVYSLPRRSFSTLSLGAQVLIDRSEAMEPFYEDQNLLQEIILKVVGRDRIKFLSFAGCPLWGAGTGMRDEWLDYQTPPRGTPVLLLTDLGIGRAPFADDRAGARDWLNFAERLRRAGCPLVAFVPYTPARWPAQLINAMTILQWDRTTTAATVKHTIGSGLRVLREA